MVFSSVLFLFYFLPILLMVYFICPVKARNWCLLIASLVFYFIGEPKNIVFLLLSCFINYYLSVLMIKTSKYKKTWLIVGVIYNVGQLFIFKYLDFGINNINSFLNLDIGLLYIVMPIGISFYTFQALSYLIDVYKGVHEKSKNVFEFIMYLSLFPQLIAGPIVRYTDIKSDLDNRKFNLDNFSSGIKMFIIGLSKKVLLANVFGELISKLTFATVLASWMRPVCYMFQIYFDFSGYSDMAIGLGLMFGFKFLKNFNYPFISSSISEFWRRWHISLSSWFRDYVYIPLGGNRVSKLKWCRNVFVVWMLTGFWHGASWNFVLWGLFFGVILVLEKFVYGEKIKKTRVVKYIYTYVLLIISFLFFSVEDFSSIGVELKNMFFLNHVPLSSYETIYYIKDYLFFILVGFICSTPVVNNLVTKYSNKRIFNVFVEGIYALLFILSIAFIVDASFNPFLYFRF